MPLQGLAALRLVRGMHRIGIGRQRHLRVDDHLLSARQVQYHIGTQVVARLILQVGLDVIVLPFDQVRMVEDRREDHLAHIALNLRVSLQGVGQIRSLVGNLAVELHQPVELVPQRPVTLHIVAVDILNPLPELRNILPKRLQKHLHSLTVGLLELPALLLEYVARHVAELFAHGLLHLFRLLLPPFAILDRRTLQLGNPRLERLDTDLTPVRLGLHTPALLGEGHDPRLRLRQPAVELTDLPCRHLAFGSHLTPQPPRLAAQHDRNGQQQHYYKRKEYDNGDIHGDKG